MVLSTSYSFQGISDTNYQHAVITRLNTDGEIVWQNIYKGVELRSSGNKIIEGNNEGELITEKRIKGDDESFFSRIIKTENSYLIGGVSHSGITSEKTIEEKGYWITEITKEDNEFKIKSQFGFSETEKMNSF